MNPETLAFEKWKEANSHIIGDSLDICECGHTRADHWARFRGEASLCLVCNCDLFRMIENPGARTIGRLGNSIS